MSQNFDYDVIIIGAGISGLVSGCYLAKAKKKTLIIEQHFVPGGYCSSFQRNGYRFDTGVHYIGGIRKGSLSKILEELDLKDYIKFNQFDPSDKIILSGRVTYIRSNPKETIAEFTKTWPDQKKNIEHFFQFILESSLPTLYKKTIEFTFKKILDEFFDCQELKTSIGVLLLGNMGLPPGEISAFAAAVFLKEFILDPAYYPVGGMQQFANALARKFEDSGGQIMLAKKVSKILVENNKAKGVFTESKEEIKSKYVISAIDATQTFNTLVKEKVVESNAINKLVPSNSIFMVCIGLSKPVKEITRETCDIWLANTDNLERCYQSLKNNMRNKIIDLIMLSFPSHHDPVLMKEAKGALQIYTMATYETKEFWEKNRDGICREMLSLSERVIPDIRKFVDLTITATPSTFYRYTLNREGAAFGWDSRVKQVKTSLLPQITSVQNLFLTGHWCIMGAGQGGISTVALSGKKVAEMVVNISAE